MTLLRLAARSSAVFALGLLFLSPATTSAADVKLSETGSTLLYPLFQLWVADYARIAPGVTISAAATGSGEGIDAVIKSTVSLGASDAYMSDEVAEHNRTVLNIPLAISAQTVNYNIPGLNNAGPGNTGLKLDGPTLAAIYAGKITEWDDAAIAALNPGVKLPHQTIVPIRRADASGDTFIFTQFLDFSTQSWEGKIGYGTTVSWPSVAGEATASGNQGMVDTIGKTPGSVGYVGISFRDAIAKAGIGTAMLKNQAGKFVLPTPEAVSNGAAMLDPRTPPDERLSLVFAPGDQSYPLVNYEYAVVSTHQPDANTAAAIRKFLLWAIAVDGGNATKYLDAVGFIPLPDFIRGLSEHQISRIGTEAQAATQ
jgi:phosphate transport system substrate-binding protein